MEDIFKPEDGATPLTPEEQEGLIPSWIASRADLNAAEEANIEEALIWLGRTKRTAILTPAFICQLHHRLFGDVWTWAGTYRTTGKNIGVDPAYITERLRLLFDDVKFWIASGTYPAAEIAVRLHHRLVFIHPFANGNGRHARVMADLMVEALGGPLPSWGQKSLVSKSETRDAYISALKSADRHDIGPLMNFAFS